MKMQKQQLALTIGLAFGISASAHAGSPWSNQEIPTLTATAAALPQGGIVGNNPYQNKQVLHPTQVTDSASSSFSSTALDGSSADASVTASFGKLRAYAVATRAPSDVIGDAQSSATAELQDYFMSGMNNALYQMTFALNGTHSSNSHLGGGSAGAWLYYRVYDSTAGQMLTSSNWLSTDTAPSTFQTIAFTVPKADDHIWLDVSLEAFAYQMNYVAASNSVNLTAFSDYSHTLNVNLDALTAGANTIGLSGYNYATVTAVPLPSTIGFVLTGLTGILFNARKRQQG